ncbi:3-deoxy-D-manno-octulosonic acid transferase [Paracoccus sp. S-4012]|uniref:glycosyltransferase N-terminal domain-containing protein n=1 Tax=Paracoccus sp. S-4012 TaxID=2665648 RepID=UPI0012AF2477|nr:glycosyltransferase N-terminal domain-containing protein [Paracoccus sp. S-4012]MRX49655.1 3-deoxy-D-manno-octulosonic acid transferase [Paracoccus sp. S-4012]
MSNGRGRALPPAPPGEGPLLWLRLAAGQPADGSGAGAALRPQLRAMRRDLRLLATHPAPVGETGVAPDPGDAATMLRELRPAAILLVGDDLPEELLLAAGRARLPVILADARLHGLRPPQLWQRSRRRAAVEALTRVLVADAAAQSAAIRAGVPEGRVERTGPLMATPAPPGCSEAERAALAAALRGRQVWFAAAVPEAEEAAVLAAHETALQHSHRALLVVAPADPERAQALMLRAEAQGLGAALRSQTDEPGPDIQVLVADDPGEAGLWYRLAPVTYAGGTLAGGATAPDPFAPAALGSAILRGPQTGAAPAAWAALEAGRALRPVRDEADLGPGVEELLAPERAAELAARAWAVSTAGAAVAQRIAAAVAAVLPPPA